MTKEDLKSKKTKLCLQNQTKKNQRKVEILVKKAEIKKN